MKGKSRCATRNLAGLCLSYLSREVSARIFWTVGDDITLSMALKHLLTVLLRSLNWSGLMACVAWARWTMYCCMTAGGSFTVW